MNFLDFNLYLILDEVDRKSGLEKNGSCVDNRGNEYFGGNSTKKMSIYNDFKILSSASYFSLKPLDMSRGIEFFKKLLLSERYHGRS